MAVRGLGCPVRFALTAGQKGDAPQAEALLADLPAEVVMADAAYDSDAIREVIAEKGALAVIPNNPSRARKHPVDEHLYAMRSLIECCFSKLKQFRRVATRYEKTARNFLTQRSGEEDGLRANVRGPPGAEGGKKGAQSTQKAAPPRSRQDDVTQHRFRGARIAYWFGQVAHLLLLRRRPAPTERPRRRLQMLVATSSMPEAMAARPAPNTAASASSRISRPSSSSS